MKHLTMMMAIGLLLLVAFGCSSSDQVSNTKPSSTPDHSESTQSTAELANGWNPQEACAYLSNINGLQTRGYKNLIEDGSGEWYTCSSHYKDLSNDFPLANNIAYYVEGKKLIADEVKLVINVYVTQKAKETHAELLLSCQELTKKALDVSMPKDVSGAVTSGKAGKWTVGKGTVELKRENFSSSKGYELHYIIRKKV